MSKKANPTIVGLFVIIGIVLLVAGIIAFSSFKVSGSSQKYLLYFDSSVKGLSVGAPVTHRGVKIGSVSSIQLRFNQANDDFSVPVFIQIDQDLIENRSDREITVKDIQLFEDLIQRGLRGKLEASSFVTGQLYIELELDPDAPPPVYHQVTESGVREIPTIQTGIEKFLSTLSSIDIVGIAQDLSSILDRLDTKIGEINTGDISKNLNDVLESIDSFLIDPDLQAAIRSVTTTLEDFTKTSEALRTEIGPIAGNINGTLRDVQDAVEEIRDGVADIAFTYTGDSVIATDLALALGNLSAASRAIAELADYLRIHPNALLTGREGAAPTK